MNWTPMQSRPSRKPARRPPVRTKFRPVLEHLECRLAPANIDVLTWHNDNTLSGFNGQETVLTPANVNPASFGKLFSQPTDGYVYAQPLYKANLPIGKEVHDVVFVATEHDSVYAFDAASPTAGPNGNGLYWQTSLLLPRPGFTVTTVPSGDTGSGDIVPEVGITGTPVIDPDTNTLYVLAKTKEVDNATNTSHYVYRLYALAISTGNIVRSVTVGDTTNTGDTNINDNATDIRVTGANTGRPGDTNPPTGPGAQGGEFRFNARRAMQRSATVLAPADAAHPNGVLYLDFASHGDNGNYRGWVIGYDPSTLQLVQFFLTALDTRGSGIWQSGAPVAIDASNNLYFATGNGFGVTNTTVGPRNLTESVVRISTAPKTGALKLDDWFIPFNWRELDQRDTDLGSGGTLLLPDAVGSAKHPHLIVETGKEGRIYLLDRDDLGGLSPDRPTEDARIVDVLNQGVQGVWGSPAFFQDGPNTGLLYYHGSGDRLKAFRITNGRFVRGDPDFGLSVDHTNNPWGFPGAQPSISSNGTSNAIVWELQTNNFGARGPEILHAYDALNLGNEIYRSDALGLRDLLGPSVKFVVPTVSNGHVYAGTANSLEVFGLFEPNKEKPPAPASLAAEALSDTQVRLSWDPVSRATGIRLFRSTDNVNFTPIAILPRNATTYTDMGLSSLTTYYYQIVATNQVGDSDPSNTAAVTTHIPASRFTITAVCSSEIDLAWTRVANDHYEIERSVDGGNTYQVIAAVPANVTTFADTGLARGMYLYRIRAFNVKPSDTSLSNVTGGTVGPITIDHSHGFDNHRDLTANGSGQFTEGFARLTDADFGQAGSVFANMRIGIGNFHTTFVFRIHEGTDPRADGFTFVIQGVVPAALGPAGGGLGYGPGLPNIAGDPRGIRNSVAIKFDFFDNAGEGDNSTGIFTDGRSPTVRRDGLPANIPDMSVDMSGSGLELNNQRRKQVDLDYDGTTLTETIVDLVDGSSFSTSYRVDIRGFVRSDTAFVGFTGGTGGLTAIQDIETWTFESRQVLPSAPSNLHITTVLGNQITLQWKCNSYNEEGFIVERSPDGTTFAEVGRTGPNETTFTDTVPGPGTYVYRVRAFNERGVSGPTNTDVITLPVNAVIDHSAGFADFSDLRRMGSAVFGGGVAYLTTGDFNSAGSFFSADRVAVARFQTTFVFEITPGTFPMADGMTFTIQGNSPTAVGAGGSGLGYQNILNSLAIKFDVFQSPGDPSNNSTGLFLNGEAPIGGIDLNGTGIDLNSRHPFRVDLSYDGTTLTETITDTVTNASFTISYTVDIVAIVGNVGFVGFTGGTGGLTAVQDVRSWVFNGETAPASPTPPPGGGRGTASALFLGSPQEPGRFSLGTDRPAAAAIPGGRTDALGTAGTAAATAKANSLTNEVARGRLTGAHDDAHVKALDQLFAEDPFEVL